MNFIQLVQETSRRVGIQGVGPSAVDVSSYETQIVKAVQDGWMEIQRMRPTWRWMREHKDFLLTTGKTTYTTSDIFGTSPRLRNWHKETFYITKSGKKSVLLYYDYDYYVYRHINDSVNKQPYEFTIRPQDNALIFESPDMAYTISCDYQKTPQRLVNETDIPEMPTWFHELIIYKALELYGAGVSFNEINTEYGGHYSILMGQLMREQNPRVKLKVRGIA